MPEIPYAVFIYTIKCYVNKPSVKMIPVIPLLNPLLTVLALWLKVLVAREELREHCLRRHV